MKVAALLSMIPVALSCSVMAQPAMAAGHENAPRPVLAHDLKDMGVTALWTRRNGYCTLQLVMEMSRTMLPLGPQRVVDGRRVLDLPDAKAPQTQAWVLRADGTSMNAMRATAELPSGMREHVATITYSFPESASKEAAAIAVMINGKYFVEGVEPFPDEK